MNSIIGRYIIGFLAGIIFGMIFQNFVPIWFLAITPIGIVVVTELVGRWVFGHRWHEYRTSGYIMHSGVAVSAWFGVLLGSGMLGKFLIQIGTLIS